MTIPHNRPPQDPEVMSLKAEIDQMKTHIRLLEKTIVAQSDALTQTQKTLFAMHKTVGLLVDTAEMHDASISKPPMPTSIRKDVTQA